ncbi:hypothetical protein DES53_103441 [Roseimicrobium gellanilyticum]|uniref:Uncharacterized protein n=1 Tax=Roseimicrobium gellanilyticum TaxID=748857 RepID=A0A366HQ17_9BACT|nr:hypothetical protein [Roseimicrobium gellanilyticum]RBP45441.1 hypothetical protein DES53_103441 [Roseimicrobium gellanilyticum]
MKILFRMAMLGLIVAMVVLVAKTDPKAVVTNQRDKAARRWIREHVPDKEVEVLGFSEERKLWDHTYLVGWARWKNASGVTVVSHHVFEVNGPTQMVNAWSAREFVATKKFELQVMPTALQGQRARELQTFCNEMGIPVEKDT